MVKTLRATFIAAFVLVAGLAASNANAQMMHYTLFVTVATQDGSAIPAGEVCVTAADNTQICQDIPAGTPDGHQFIFEGLGTGDYGINVSADGYYGVSEDIRITEVETYATLTLTLPDPTTPTPAPDLPDTGTGTISDAGSSSFLLLTGLLGMAGIFSVGAAMSRRSRQ